MSAQPLVLDTNIVLDAFVYADPRALPVREGLAAGRFHWLATQPMRDELERVLTYASIAARMSRDSIEPAAVLAAFDAGARIAPAAPKAPVTCKDPDDQKFIDLAVAHGAWLLSKDHAVLSMKKRLLALQVRAAPALEALG
ncbi:MAG: PIN domain-containing protein [Burkholderiaceae bacterium]